MDKIYITICDDENHQIEYLTALVREWAKERGTTLCISTFESAESFLFAYEEDKSADILLLDIQMREIDGIELARKIRQDNDTVQIVFITGLPNFISEGYDVSALHYLMKPVKEEKLFWVLDKAVAHIKKEGSILLAQTIDGTVRISQRDILYIEAVAHDVIVQTKKATLDIKTSIGEVQNLLDNTFIRCHRSYIVGLRHIGFITKTDIFLDNNKAIPLSRRLYNEVNRAFIDYYKGGR